MMKLQNHVYEWQNLKTSVLKQKFAGDVFMNKNKVYLNLIVHFSKYVRSFHHWIYRSGVEFIRDLKKETSSEVGTK
jgi:hypothetical protein